MMQVYYERASWISGIAVFIAFVLTFWPTRPRMITAAALWTLGVLSLTGLGAYDTFLRGGIAYAFSSPSSSFPLFGWLVPLVTIGLAITQSVLLFPWVQQERAMRWGMVIFLIVAPIVAVLMAIPYLKSGITRQFPLGIGWLGFPLLWFRIRERSNFEKA